MEQTLANKVAVITGGSRGLGLVIAQTYAKAGAKVVIASRSAKSVEQAVENLKASGYTAVGLSVDVADITQVEALASLAKATFGHIDIWVNNAGLSAPYGPTAHIPARNFSNVINTNITGTYNGSVVALRYFVPQKSGKLINMLGSGDTGSIKFQNAYTSSKVWVRNFTKALAAEYQGSGVDIFGFNPGLVLTEMLSQVNAITGYEEKVSIIRTVATIWGNEAEVPAMKALWLVSSATDGMNGKMVKILIPIFMLSRLMTTGVRLLLRAPVDMMDLTISSIEPVMELAPVLVEK